MKTKRLGKYLAGLTMLAGACGDAGEMSPDMTIVPANAASMDVASVDGALATIAAHLARASADDLFRQQLLAALAERRTGDYEVLLSDVAAMTMGDGSRFGHMIRSVQAQELPLIHVASPGGVSSFASNAAVSVTWTPVEDEDRALLEFFGPDGGKDLRPAAERPSGPTLVVGVNERLEGRMTISASGGIEAVQQPLSAHNCNGWRCTSGSCRDVYLRDIKIYDDHEPWHKGDPEIYIFCTTPGARFDQIHFDCGSVDLPGVNDENKTYSYSRLLLDGLAAGYPIQCHVMERDGGKTHPVDADDSLGSATLRYENSGIYRYYTSDATFTTR